MSTTIRVFDPAMCCSTGVCGPVVDPALARFAADVAWLRKQGVVVERFNLAQEPAAFADTPAVQAALQAGPEVLPLVLIDEHVVTQGAYPTREALAALAGLSDGVAAKPAPSPFAKLVTPMAVAADANCCSPATTSTNTMASTSDTHPAKPRCC